jgi:hypothetical protein
MLPDGTPHTSMKQVWATTCGSSMHY